MTDTASAPAAKLFGVELIKHEVAIKNAIKNEASKLMDGASPDVHLQQEITNLAASMARSETPIPEVPDADDIHVKVAVRLVTYYLQTVLEMKRELATMQRALSPQHYITAARFARYTVEDECDIRP